MPGFVGRGMLVSSPVIESGKGTLFRLLEMVHSKHASLALNVLDPSAPSTVALAYST